MTAPNPLQAHIHRLRSAAQERLPAARNLLCGLIRIPSTAGNEAPAIDHLQRRCRDLGGRAELVPLPSHIIGDPDYSFLDTPLDCADRRNLSFLRPGSGGGRSLAISAHLDVVPATGWPDAFEPKTDGDYVIGRGASDDKGQVVAVWLALQLLDALDIATQGDVEAQFVIEEEIGGNGALGMILAGHIADAALVMECTDLQIHPANRGAIWYRIRIIGKSAHMGRIREGVSAHDRAIQVIEILRRYEQRLLAESRGVPLFERYQQPVQVNVGMVRAGDWPATVPGECVIEGGVGFLPNKKMADVKRELGDTIRREADEWTREHFTIDFPKLHNDAYQTDPNHPFVRAVSAAAADAGVASDVFGWNMSCDARLYHHRGHMPTVVFGPGEPAQAHAAGERIAMSQIADAAVATALLIARWCGVAQ
jgi:acetylornithine deacetylase